MAVTVQDQAADALLAASSTMLGIVIRSIAAGPYELTVAQHRVLVLVEDVGELSVGAVAEQLGVDQSTASRHCTRLDRLGLVTRTRARHDGRAVDVRLTPEGHRQVSAVQRARRAEIAQILARMPTAVLAESVDAWTAFERATVETTPAW